MSNEIYTEYRNQIAQMSWAAQNAYFRYVSNVSESLAEQYDNEYRRVNKLCRDNYKELYFSNCMEAAGRELCELKYARDYYRRMHRIYDRTCMNM
jgi:hypothetical protein